jgi:hypothetical protein
MRRLKPGEGLSDADDHGVDHGAGPLGVAVGAQQVVAPDGQGHHCGCEVGCFEPRELRLQQGRSRATVDGKQGNRQRRVTGAQIPPPPLRELVVPVPREEAGAASARPAGIVIDRDRVAQGDVDVSITIDRGTDRG